MYERIVRWAAAVAVFALWPAAAGADSIRLVSSSRSTTVSAIAGGGQGDSQQNADLLSAATTRSFEASTASASSTLSSSISDPRHLSGSGFAVGAIDADAANVGATAVASYAVDLELDTPFTFDFGGIFSVSGGPCCQTGEVTSSGSWRAMLSRGTEFIFLHNIPESSTTSSVFTRSGVLGPGLYRLVIEADGIASHGPGTGRGTGEFRFTFDLSENAPVPEPASMLLVGTGILGLVRAGRRRCAPVPKG